MASAKNVVWIVVLVALIVGAVVFGISRTRRGEMKMPETFAGRPLEMIDVETLELITQSASEWNEGGHEGVYFENPQTGRYTMTPPQVCKSCGEKIPAPPPPEEASRGRGEIPVPSAPYACPRCGGRP